MNRIELVFPTVTGDNFPVSEDDTHFYLLNIQPLLQILLHATESTHYTLHTLQCDHLQQCKKFLLITCARITLKG